MSQGNQYPNPLPSSGNISIGQIADWMLAAGEITQAERNGPLGMEFLNGKSHLAKKTEPYLLSDWHGYSKV